MFDIIAAFAIITILYVFIASLILIAMTVAMVWEAILSRFKRRKVVRLCNDIRNV